MSKKEEEEAILWFYNAAYETTPYLNLKYKEEYPIRMIAACYKELGDFEAARTYEALLK